MMDGMPMIGLADHITKTTYRDAQNRSYALPQGDDVGEVENIFEGFNLDPQVDECIVKGKFCSTVAYVIACFYIHWPVPSGI